MRTAYVMALCAATLSSMVYADKTCSSNWDCPQFYSCQDGACGKSCAVVGDECHKDVDCCYSCCKGKNVFGRGHCEDPESYGKKCHYFGPNDVEEQVWANLLQ